MSDKNKLEETNEQKSSKPDRKLAIIAISVFMAFLTLPMLLWGILGLFPSGHEIFEVELEENRAPFEMPEKIDLSTLTADLDSYINDRLPFRSAIVYTYNNLSNSLEKPYKNWIRPTLIKIFYSNSNPINTPTINPPINNDIITGTDSETEEIKDQGNEECQHVLIESIIKDATCFVDGEGEKICENCDYSVSYTIRGGHSGTVLKVVQASYADYGYTLNKCDRCQGEYRTNIVDKLYYNTPFPLTLSGKNAESGQAIEGRDEWLFYTGNNSIGYYQGTNKMSQQQLEEYTAVLQELHELCEAKGKKLAIFIPPNKEQVYFEYMPTLEIESGKKRTQLFVEYVQENSDVNIIYPYEELLAAKPYWQVYSRLDTHWNAAGGFIGLQALYKALGLETTPMYNLPVVESLANTLSASDLINIGGYQKSDFSPDVDYDISYKEDITAKLVKSGGSYNFETNGIAVTESDSANQCNFVMLGDSFRKNMVRYLIKDFSNTLCTHRSNINVREVQEAIINADIIVIESVERIDESVMNAAKAVINILKKQ